MGSLLSLCLTRRSANSGGGSAVAGRGQHQHHRRSRTQRWRRRHPGDDAHRARRRCAHLRSRPADLVALEGAAVVFENGLGLEPWLDRFWQSTQPPGRASSLPRASSRCRPALRGQNQADAHEQGAFDPHVWHDVANAIVMVENIREALDAADPAHAATYDANAAAYTAELKDLDTWVREQVANSRRSAENSSPITTPSPISPKPTGSRFSAPRSARSRPRSAILRPEDRGAGR